MNHRYTSGFTLIELLIVVAIVGILGTVMAGYYGSYVISSNRTDARTALSATATSLEKCKSLYSGYNHANCNVKFGTAIKSDKGYYAITAPTLTASTFTLTATPVAGQPQASDAECKSLSLTNTGMQTATGTATDECW